MDNEYFSLYNHAVEINNKMALELQKYKFKLENINKHYANTCHLYNQLSKINQENIEELEKYKLALELACRQIDVNGCLICPLDCGYTKNEFDCVGKIFNYYLDKVEQELEGKQ
jgi:hypothetical protein